MKHPFATLLLSLLAALMLAGCNTLDSRIKKNEALFRSLDPATQQKLRNKTVEIGYTPDMVYIALGDPTEKSVRTTEKGTLMTWSYQNSYDEYEGTAVYYQRTVMVDPKTGLRYIVNRPVSADVYSEQTEELLRIEFKDGLVSSIEQSK